MMVKGASDARAGFGSGGFARAFRCTAVAVCPAFLLGGCAGGILDPRGPIGAADSLILLDSVGIMAVIVVPTIAGLLAIAWWFRASNTRARYQPEFVYSGRLELIVWAIPILVIMFLGGVTWVGSHELDPYVPIAAKVEASGPPLEVQVISLDWKWLFIYPQQRLASVNEVFVPTGTAVHFYLTSATVMNQFFVPQLGSMIATMNGMQTQLYLQADRDGDYIGLSAQFSGDGFSDMRFTVHAVSPADFQSWTAAARQSGPVLDRNGYLGLLRGSCDVQPFTYRSADPGLFAAVVKRDLPSGSGPHVGGTGAGIRSKGCG
jgi:cytochrome o ubiquinol oxidase subunit II